MSLLSCHNNVHRNEMLCRRSSGNTKVRFCKTLIPVHSKVRGGGLGRDLRRNECSCSIRKEDSKENYGPVKEENWKIRTNETKGRYS